MSPKTTKPSQFSLIAERCKGCGFCIEFCPQHILSRSKQTNSKAYHLVNMDDADKCTGCGLCTEACVVRKVTNEFDCGLSKRSAAYIPFAQAVPLYATIDPQHCLTLKGKKCKQPCVTACGPGAIDFEQKDETVEITVGAVVLATGYQLWDASLEERYGYGRLDDVITSLEFERLSNASGPTAGRILRKNGEPPNAVAILHCVGSRDVRQQEWCSRVCCMSALKFAHLIKEQVPDAEIYEFYIDMRCFGKGYEEFYKRLMDEGVHMVRGRVAEITKGALTSDEEGRLLVKAEDTLLGAVRRIAVDMAVLTVGLAPNDDAREVAQMFGIGCSASGFYLECHPKLEPVATATDGIFIAGCCQAPKDIPDTVAQARAAAGRILARIAKGKIEIDGVFAEVDQDRCSGCRMCNELCPYSAIEFDAEKRRSNVIAAACKACGACVAACPSCAITARHFTDQQIFSQIEGILA